MGLQRLCRFGLGGQIWIYFFCINFLLTIINSPVVACSYQISEPRQLIPNFLKVSQAYYLSNKKLPQNISDIKSYLGSATLSNYIRDTKESKRYSYSLKSTGYSFSLLMNVKPSVSVEYQYHLFRRQPNLWEIIFMILRGKITVCGYISRKLITSYVATIAVINGETRTIICQAKQPKKFNSQIPLIVDHKLICPQDYSQIEDKNLPL